MREIIKDRGRLRQLAEEGVGIVHNPFDKRMHHAACATVRERMSATCDGPLWYFPSQEQATDFLAGHVQRYPTAAWQVARCCAEMLPDLTAVAAPAAGPPQARTRASNAVVSDVNEPTMTSNGRSIAVWSDCDVRNETPADSPGGRLRSQLCAWLRTARPDGGELLEASYGGERRNNADVENLLFNNIDQEAGAYRAACTDGLRFSWLGPQAPPAPDGTQRAYHYRYRVVEEDARMPGVRLGEWVRRWSQVPLSEGFASRPGRRLSTRVWWSLRQHEAQRRGDLEPESTFAIRLVLHGETVDPAAALKGAFDGIVAALQVQKDVSGARQAAAVMAGETSDKADAIALALTQHSDPALGSVDRLLRAVNARHGADLRWDPADSACIAGEVLVGERSGPARLDVELVSCTLQPSAAR